MITYPVDTEATRWSVYQISTESIVGRNKVWPVLDGSEIPGADPDYVYLLESETARPDHDDRLYYLEANEVVDVDANTIKTSWSAVKRPMEERLVSAENVETNKLRDYLVLEKEVIETRLVLAAILNHISGLKLPPKVQKLTNKYKSNGAKIWANRDRLEAIKAEIEAGDDPDLDAGWQVPDDEFVPGDNVPLTN